MIDKLYLSAAFGWDSESIAKVAISQLRTESKIYCGTCPKAQLIKNGSFRWQPNMLKLVGYIPVINILAGVFALVAVRNEYGLSPNHASMWKVRGVAMILTGPLLVIVDAIKFIFDSVIAAKYHRENPDLIEKFNTTHGHSNPPWTGHPVDCFMVTVPEAAASSS